MATALQVRAIERPRLELVHLDESGLVLAYIRGEDRAFTELVRRYQFPLLNFFWRMIGDRTRAEDLVQETFIRVHRHIHRFDRKKKFSTWVYTIASNLAKNELRNRSRDPIVLFGALEHHHDSKRDRPLNFVDKRSHIEDIYEKKRLESVVAEAVLGLTPHHRQVFVLREIEGKSYGCIAEITGCNLGTVKSRLNRARAHFAAIVEPYI